MQNKKQNTPTFSELFRNPWLFLSFGFGAGLSPFMPGTMGTMMAVPLYLLLAQTSLVVYIILSLAAVLLGIYLCGYSAKKLGVHDHPGIVWDEFAGYWITMTAIPLTWKTVVVGFVLFRLFDMIKPWPIGLVDKKVGGGFGIMLDDVLAGIAAWAILFALVSFGVL